jgi:hypothetical protein
VVSHSGDGDDVEHAVRGSVAAAAEAMATAGAAPLLAGVRHRRAWQMQPRCDALGVVARGDQKLADPDAVQLDQRRWGSGDGWRRSADSDS